MAVGKKGGSKYPATHAYTLLSNNMTKYVSRHNNNPLLSIVRTRILKVEPTQHPPTPTYRWYSIFHVMVLQNTYTKAQPIHRQSLPVIYQSHKAFIKLKLTPLCLHLTRSPFVTSHGASYIPRNIQMRPRLTWYSSSRP